MVENDYLSRKIIEWRAEPVLMVRQLFKTEPDAWQRDVLVVFPTSKRIAMQACKGPGKSCVEAWCAWNFLLTRHDPKVIATSITGDNLYDGLWTEMAKWRQTAPLLNELFEQNSDRIFLRERSETHWMSARTWPKDADPTAQANTLAGIHAENVLFLLDEVAEFPEGVVAAAEAALSTGRDTKLMVAGNPTADGPLYRIVTKDRAQWAVFEITGDPDNPKRAPRVDRKWARDMIDRYGRDSNYVRVNVLGLFPHASEDKFYDPTQIDGAFARVVPGLQEVKTLYARILGVDVARYGNDQTVFCERFGPVVTPMWAYRELNLMEVANRVAELHAKQPYDAIFVDQTGLGAGVVDRLRELGAPVIGVDFGSRALRKGYANRRTEMYANLRDWLPNGALPPDEDLRRDLLAPAYRFDAKGTLFLESKDDMRSRGLPSPDRADALVLTFAAPVVAKPQIHGRFGPQKPLWDDYDPLARMLEE